MSTDDMSTGDMSTGDEFEARLTAAGQRWREANTTPAAVDLAAITGAGGREPGAELSRDSAEPLPLVPAAPARTGRRRTRVWLAAVGVAAAVAATVVAVQLTGGSSGRHRPAATSGAPLVGTDWQLSGTDYTWPAGSSPSPGTAGPAKVTATLHLAADGTLSGRDGCNSFGGKATVSGDEIAIGQLASTAMGCLGAEVNVVRAAVDGVLTGTVRYAIDGDRLTITKDGVGSLTYTAQHHTTSTDPAMLEDVTWQLSTITLGNDIARPNAASSSAPEGAWVAFVAGRVVGSDGCNSFDARGDLGAGAITVSHFADSTTNRCSTASSPEWALVLQGAQHWTLTDDRLTLTDAHGGELVFDQKPDLPITDPHALVGTNWTLISITHGDGGLPDGAAPSEPVVLRVGDGGLGLGDYDAAAAEVQSGRIHVTSTWTDNTVAGPGRLSAPESHFVYGQLLTGTVTWAIRDGALTIAKPSVGSLVFKGAPAAGAPSDTATAGH